MQRLIHIRDDGTRVSVDPGELGTLEGGWWWLDLTDASDEQLHTIADRLGLDRVARDDLFETQFPKLELLDRHWMLVVHALAADAESLRTVELDVLVGENWVVTSHREPLPSIDHISERILRPAFGLHDATHLVVRIVEFVGERYLLILDDLEAQILDLEDEAVDGDPRVLPDIHALRRDIALLRRVLGPQRRTLDALSRNGVGLTDRSRRDLADAIDHHNRLVDSLEASHQMVATVLDTYRGAAAERMNEVMKVLTVVSAIFLPLTLVAGIYGMNFTYMPELERRWGYFASLGLMATIAVTMWIYFVRRGFIGGPKVRDLSRPAKAAGRVGRGLASATTLPLRATTRVASRATTKLFNSEVDRRQL